MAAGSESGSDATPSALDKGKGRAVESDSEPGSESGSDATPSALDKGKGRAVESGSESDSSSTESTSKPVFNDPALKEQYKDVLDELEEAEWEVLEMEEHIKGNLQQAAADRRVLSALESEEHTEENLKEAATKRSVLSVLESDRKKDEIELEKLKSDFDKLSLKEAQLRSMNTQPADAGSNNPANPASDATQPTSSAETNSTDATHSSNLDETSSSLPSVIVDTAHDILNKLL
jgi:hypothetical protein